MRFRQRVLGRPDPMSAEEAEAFLDRPQAGRDIAHASDAPAGVLRYQNLRIAHEIHVWAGTPLDGLRLLADELARSYPWQPAQAAPFVLEGLIPLATPFMLRMPQSRHDGRPARARLILEVDLWMPASEVMRAYRDAQRRVLPGHNRPVSRRSIDVVNFVVQHRRATWPVRLERWNSDHPRRRFKDYRTLRTAFERAKRELLAPDYRIYAGPDSQS